MFFHTTSRAASKRFATTPGLNSSFCALFYILIVAFIEATLPELLCFIGGAQLYQEHHWPHLIWDLWRQHRMAAPHRRYAQCWLAVVAYSWSTIQHSSSTFCSWNLLDKSNRKHFRIIGVRYILLHYRFPWEQVNWNFAYVIERVRNCILIHLVVVPCIEFKS